MSPFLAEIEVIGAPISYFLAGIGAVILLALGATIVSLFGTVKDKISRWVERIFGSVLLVILTTSFLGLLLTVIIINSPVAWG